MDNPLLLDGKLPPFSKIKPEHVEPAIDLLLAKARQTVAHCLAATCDYRFDNLVTPIADAENRLHKAWSPVSHLNSVANNDELRAAYNACLPKLSDYATEMGQNEALYQAYLYIKDSDGFDGLAPAQQRIITNALRDFTLSGVGLPADQKQRYKAISLELSMLASKFEENLLDATNAWRKLVTDEGELCGLPASALAQARQAAEQEGLDGWLLNLRFPSYHAVLTYADDRRLRREHYTAFATRASDQGPHAGRWDNGQTMAQILALRHEKARLLGFEHYAELSLATKMANHPDEVTGFLEDLAARTWRQARKEWHELCAFAAKHHGVNDLQAWDIGYYSEKLRQHQFQFSQEEVRAYFPITRVLPGLFAIVERLYGLKITEVGDVDVWHPEVRFFQIDDDSGQLRGHFYLDLYARAKKRGGAWMDDYASRKRSGQHLQTPVAYLTCNFSPPTADTPALLTHDEVVTLFHEFGHGLHHLLTTVDHLGVSGINGVEWDAVELPSQFMENWCFERPALALLCGHHQTGAPLPEALFEKMLAAKHFQAGLAMLRQLEFSLFDFHLHQHHNPNLGARVYETLERVRRQVAVVTPPKFSRFAHSFAHIFAGGYAAGYYSYKWAEVLSSDAFSLFEERGIFDRATGQAFLSHILEQGGSRGAMELFVNFRGRPPTIDALLRHSGIHA